MRYTATSMNFGTASGLKFVIQRYPIVSLTPQQDDYVGRKSHVDSFLFRKTLYHSLNSNYQLFCGELNFSYLIINILTFCFKDFIPRWALSEESEKSAFFGLK